MIRWLLRQGLRAVAALALVLAWIVLFLTPRTWMWRLLGRFRQPERADGAADASRARIAQRIARSIDFVADRLPWRSTCLVRALAGLLMLACCGMNDAVIRFGVRKNGADFEAHAWLLWGNSILLGGEVAPTFTPLADLGGSARDRTA